VAAFLPAQRSVWHLQGGAILRNPCSPVSPSALPAAHQSITAIILCEEPLPTFSCLAPVSWTWVSPADSCAALCSCMCCVVSSAGLLVDACLFRAVVVVGSDCFKPSRSPGPSQVSQHAPLPDLCLMLKGTVCNCREALPIAERCRPLLGAARPCTQHSVTAVGAWPAQQGMIASASARLRATPSALLQSGFVARLCSG